MAVWMSRRFRRWVLFTIGPPVLGWALGRAGDELERRRGPSTSTELLRSGGDLLNRRRRGRTDVRTGGEPDGDR